MPVAWLAWVPYETRARDEIDSRRLIGLQCKSNVELELTPNLQLKRQVLRVAGSACTEL